MVGLHCIKFCFIIIPFAIYFLMKYNSGLPTFPYDFLNVWLLSAFVSRNKKSQLDNFCVCVGGSCWKNVVHTTQFSGFQKILIKYFHTLDIHVRSCVTFKLNIHYLNCNLADPVTRYRWLYADWRDEIVLDIWNLFSALVLKSWLVFVLCCVLGSTSNRDWFSINIPVWLQFSWYWHEKYIVWSHFKSNTFFWNDTDLDFNRTVT